MLGLQVLENALGSPQQALEIAEALANAACKLLGLPHLPRRPLRDF
jgi:hypothetical protein